MNRIIKYSFFISIISVMIVACSTEKNSAINRGYHGLTAHYNGYFNANELIRQSMNTYVNSRVEDYYNLLPIDPLPNQDEVIGMYPAIDTAITKCKKVIRNHSMPSNDRPAYKKEEHNKWIDENWTTIGIASYYRRDYEGAIKSFEFVKKFYSNDPSLYVGELWMAKTHIAQGKFTKAKFNLDNLDKAITEESRRERSTDSKSKKKNKKDKKDEIAKFPQKIRFDLEKTKAALAIEKGEYVEAISSLEESLKYARFNDNTSRVHFVLGQLYQEQGDKTNAALHYTKVIKGKAGFSMSFNARLKRAFLGEGPKVKKELNKMLRDAKNAEFKDQIYYAMADVELKEGNESKGIEYLTQCAFYSTKNTRQKGMAYERLGDMSFTKKNYVSAQKYYDSCATVIPETYPNGEAIRNKAENLSKLVVAVETAQYEDSVQRIAAMNESDRESFLKDLIKKIKEEEARRKQREAERLRELQENENLFVQDGNGSKWYWNNAKTRTQGYEEFKKMWGTRENEDDWRRSEKTPRINIENIDDPEALDTLIVTDEDTLTVENLMRWLPLNDSLLAMSNKRLLQSYYNAGIIYNDQLNEAKLAEGQFNAVLKKDVENPHNLLSAYQLYKMKIGSPEQDVHKSYILNNYPNSDFANYIRDPEYFIKKKERDALAEQEYVTVLDRYGRGLYYPVLTRSSQVILEDKENAFRAKYMLLNALCTGQLNENKQDMLPTLEAVIAEYPGSMEAVKAKEMIDIIKNGYSENIDVDFENKSAFEYVDNEKLRIIIFLDEGVTSNSAKTKITDFHREFFSLDKLKVNSKIFGDDRSVILVDEFDNESKASEYIRVYKKTRKHLLDLQNAKIMMITSENMKTLFQKNNLAEYEVFYEEYY